jgi:urease accessory protein
LRVEKLVHPGLSHQVQLPDWDIKIHDAMTTSRDEQQALKDEIHELEQKLQDAKLKLKAPNGIDSHSNSDTLAASSLHTLLLLADSALPLGSFAFSSGLESYLAHSKEKALVNKTGTVPSQYELLQTFLHLSLQSLSGTALPYVLATYRDPTQLQELDNNFDASTPCTVARRASVAQGRALLSVWDRSYRSHYPPPISTSEKESVAGAAIIMLHEFSGLLRGTSSDPYPPNAHLAPLWGVITQILSIPLHSAAYLFLFSHARTVISAAVRASVLGPYQAQALLASAELRDKIEALVVQHWDRTTEEAGQAVPVMDLWVGRHEMLYSRIFNS